MPDADLDRALQLLDQLEGNRETPPRDVEHAVHNILSAAGYAISAPSLRNASVDMTLTGVINGKAERVGVEVKSRRGSVSGQTIYQALGALHAEKLDRIIIVSLGGYSRLALDRAGTDRFGKVDLLDASDLRSWLHRHAVAKELSRISIHLILRQAMRDLAARLAAAPDEIYQVEWRDMERLLREVFERLGFETHLTASARDGGFDLRLVDPEGRNFIVEVKHWLSKVGKGTVKRLVEVTARMGATSGLLLATGGFAATVFDGMIEAKAPVRLGDGDKIASLCRAFYRAETQLWQPEESLTDLLLSNTFSLPVGTQQSSRREPTARHFSETAESTSD